MFVNFFTLTILSMSKFFSDDRFPSSEATKMSIGEMINRIDDRDLQVPEYQREFVWNKKQTQGYLDSLSRCMPLFGPVVNLNTDTGEQSIMDGQNRIMTIYKFMKDEISFTNEDDETLKYSDLSDAEQRQLKNIKVSYIETRDWTLEQCQDFFMSIQGGEKLKDGEKIHARSSNILNHKITEIFDEFNDLFTNKSKDGGMGLTPAYMKRYGHYEIIGTLIHMARTNEYPIRPGRTAMGELEVWENTDLAITILDLAVDNVRICLEQYRLIMMNVPRLKEKVKKEEHLRLLYFIYRSGISQNVFTDDIYIRIETLLNRVLNKDNPEFRQIITWGTGGAENIYGLYSEIYGSIN